MTAAAQRAAAGVADQPYLIGLTGNIATGKSTVAAVLAQLGATVIDADKVAHQVMGRGGEVYERIVAALRRWNPAGVTSASTSAAPSALRPSGDSAPASFRLATARAAFTHAVP